MYSGHNIIAENGRILKESGRFTNETIYAEIDIERLEAERRRMSTFQIEDDHVHIRVVGDNSLSHLL